MKHEYMYEVRSRRREVVTMTALVTTTTNGTIGTVTPVSLGGMSVEKTPTKTGRYTVRLQGGARAALLGVDVTLIGLDDAAYTNARGCISMVRANTVATDGTFFVQFMRNSDLADAEVADGASFLVTARVALV